MGLQVDRTDFSEADHRRFAARLTQNLETLRALLDSGALCEREASLGAEVELSIVDRDNRPLPIGRQLLAGALDDRWQLELDRFNLEYNLAPVAAAGRPFRALQEELQAALAAVDAAASAQDGSIRLVGILPTLTEADLTSHAMTDLPRYQALSAALRRQRERPFEIAIDGEIPLRTRADDVTLEGANTSFQLHVRTPADAFAGTFNALQLATAPALALSTNAPIFASRRLWEETRVALFKQSVDTRVLDPERVRRPARVSFGNGWVHKGAYELFAQAVALHPVLLPVCGDRDTEDGAPSLAELRLHAGTVWSWNRPVYDPQDGGHLRIEARALPSGPTPIDMMASAAFLIGVALGLATEVDTMTEQMPFSYATWNFYRAAKDGLDAELVWPGRHRMRTLSARELSQELLPVAHRGLQMLGVDASERHELLDLVAARLDAGTTGARWMNRRLAHLEGSLERPDALRELVADYGALSSRGNPVHTWPA